MQQAAVAVTLRHGQTYWLDSESVSRCILVLGLCYRLLSAYTITVSYRRLNELGR